MIGNTNAGQQIPSVNNPTITFTQGGVPKGSINLNQSNNETIPLDGNGYKKITGTISSWTQQGGAWCDGQTIPQDGITHDGILGLQIGEEYTLVCSLGTFTATAWDGEEEGASGAVGITFSSGEEVALVFADNMNYDFEYESGKCTVMNAYDGGSFSVTSLTGQGIGGGGSSSYTATISNSAIKVNSSVDMFVNTAINFTAEKTEGAITLTTNTQPNETLSYTLECFDTLSASDLSIINTYRPSSLTPDEVKDLIGENMFFTNDSTSPATIYGGTWTELGTMSVGSSTIHCWKRS